MGGTGDDIVTLGATITGGTIDLGSGSDSLTLADAATNTLTVANVETLIGGTGDDIVTLGTTITGGTIDLGSGDDKLTLANAATNTLTVSQYRNDRRWHGR